MSKELTPLEAFREILFVARSYSSDNVVGYLEEFYKDKLYIIETALKRLKELEEEKQSFDRQLEKKLKALEIIKETLGLFFYENELGYFIDIGHCCSYKLKNKEEYDLLKEVLL